jgi:UDP-N-acetylmuramate--alanine ligase
MRDAKHIYFIGIGGIGMSAIARYFHAQGKRVTGYDKTETALTRKLVDEGIHVHYDDTIEAIPTDIDTIIYTPAIPKDHKGYNHLLASGIPMMKRSQALGMISEGMFSIGIAGTHGKTTTSSLTTHVLKVGEKDPSAFLGGIMVDYNTNCLIGRGQEVVLEADEFDRSFLQLSPDIACILSMDPDHLDIYGDEDQMHEGFMAFAEKIKENGVLLIKDAWYGKMALDTVYELLSRNIEILAFGDLNGNIQYKNVRIESGKFVFDYQGLDREIKNMTANMAGRHNIENACVAITIGLLRGVSEDKIRKAVAEFKGIQRRFERIIDGPNVQFIDDYAHHPSELKAAIGAAKELFPDKKILGIFQPHLYSRTRDFVDGFAEELSKLDEVVLMDIYPARELPIESVTSSIIFDKINNPNKHLVTKATLMDTLKDLKADVYMTLGAGDIDTFVTQIKNMLHER